MDDLALLKKYADSGSEEAFRELVARYLAIVYSAALRQVGELLAADVTQAVFVLLARKAGKLRLNTVLSAWLLTTTRLVSRATMRSEIRRRRREQEAIDMPLSGEPSDIREAWEQVQPMLDDALAGLSKSDRSLVALRFFEGKSHAEIATVLGLSEEASKKRLSRAVGRLRAFFGHRGITVAAAPLLAAISENAVQAAPAGLALKVTAAVSGAGSSGTVTALVKTTLKVMAWTKAKIALVSGVGVVLVATVAGVATRPFSRVARGIHGQIFKLESYAFQAGNVRYTFPLPSPWQRWRAKLPETVQRSPNFVKPANTASMIRRPTAPGDPQFGAVISWQVNSNYPSIHVGRLAVTDDQGNEFDQAANDMNSAERGGKEYWPRTLPAFPRRGRQLRLRAMLNNDLIAEFKIPNPAPGPHPVWHVQPLPLRTTAGSLEASLVSFRAVQTRPETSASRRRFSRTECVFQLRENGRETLAWRVGSMEVFDATGNHWRPYPGWGFSETNAAGVHSAFFGALWAGESAWKLRVEFRRVAEFPENELLRITKIRIPEPSEIYEPFTQHEWNEAVVEVSAVIGTDVKWDELPRLNLAERKKGCITVALAGEILSRNRQLTFVGATDEQGRRFELADLRELGVPEYQMPLSFALKPPEGAQEINLVVAVSERRFMEFLAKPEQVKE